MIPEMSDMENFINCKPIDLSPAEKQIDELLQQSGLYLQTYRAIDAMRVLKIAQDIVLKNNVRWQLKSPLFSNIGNAYIQMGDLNNGIEYLKKAYECNEDGNNKAALAITIASYLYRSGDRMKALEYADKGMETATALELKAACCHIQGAVAAIEEDYPKAIELFNKAVELSEQAHCLSDMAMYILDISAVYLKMGLPETALSEIYRAERHVKECRNLDLYTRCAIRKAKILYIMNRDEEARTLVMALDDQQNLLL